MFAMIGFVSGGGGVWLRILWGRVRERSRLGAGLLIALAGASVFLGAQAFPRDSQLTVSRRAPPIPDETTQRDIAELLIQMHAQQVINAQTLGAVDDLKGRVQRIETIKPDVIVLRVESLESSARQLSALLLGILGAILLNFWSSWSKRPKQADAE